MRLQPNKPSTLVEVTARWLGHAVFYVLMEDCVRFSVRVLVFVSEPLCSPKSSCNDNKVFYSIKIHTLSLYLM